MARLVVVLEVNQQEIHELADEVTTIGRNTENTVALNDKAASRFHAEIHRRERQYYVRDLGSTHGTFVNNVRNNYEMLLTDNDRIRIGTTEIVFNGDEPAVPAPLRKNVVELPVPPAIEELDSQPVADLAGETIAFSMPADRTPIRKGLSEQHLDILAKTAEAIQSVFDLNELLGALMDMIFDIFHPDRGVVLLRDETDGALVPKITRPEGEKLAISQTIIDHAVQQRVSLLVSDTAEDQRFSGAQSILSQSILSAICSPLVCKDEVLGVLYIDTQSHQLINYEKEDLALLNIIAANAAIAIENAMLVQEKVDAERLAGIGLAVAGMAHYVKNILAGIMGSTSLIEQALSTDKYDVVKKIWPVQQRANQRITSLVQDMLTYSKEREPDWEPGNFNKLLTEVFEQQEPRASSAGVELALEMNEEIPDSMFEHKAIHDTILNIAGNAVEACAETSNAQVVLRSEFYKGPTQVCLSVSDNGPGIPEDIQRKIFEPFFSTKGSKGTGLGLAVARKTVEEHGGRIGLESAPGKGATFKLVFPLRDSEVSNNTAG